MLLLKAYCGTAPPAGTVACSWLLPFGQIVPGVAVTLLIVGGVFTDTTTEAGAELHPFAMLVRLYVPAVPITTGPMAGFCCVLVNPFGPVQTKEVPISLLPLSCNVCPRQPGEDDAEAEGMVACPTTVVAVVDPPQASVINTLHVPITLATWVCEVPAAVRSGFVQAYVYGAPPPVGFAINVTVPPGPHSPGEAGVMLACPWDKAGLAVMVMFPVLVQPVVGSVATTEYG